MKQEKKKVSRILWALTLVLMMLVTGVLGATEVQAAGIEAPTITKAFIGTNTISGGNLHRGKINGKNARGTVHVTLKDSSGNEKATVSVTPKSGTTWKVNLPEGVTIAEGDTVTAYQEFDGQNSPVTTANAMDSLAKQNKDKLKMPEGEIWIEQTSSNQVNDDEQAEAVQMLKDANTAIAGDIKSVKFSINTAEHAYYEVTYTDGSTSGQVEATNLQIKQVTEHSRGATLGSITIVDNVIKGQLSGEGPFDGIKVQILLKLSDAVKDSYCDGGKCLVDKDTSKPVDATVDGKTGEFSYTIPNPDLKLDQKVGVTVKEPHKFKSCSQTTVQPVKVDKTEVKDPRKLTAKDKEAIDAAIRKGYTVNGVSKLPNGTGDWDGVPAVIQIDDSGNAKIFSGNDVKGDWDNEGNFVPGKNEDGSVKINDGAQPKITIPAKDLLKNIKPIAPELKEEENNKVTITPNKEDTDITKVTVKYKDKNNEDQTVEITKTDGNWTIPADSKLSVDSTTGLFTFDASDVINGGTVTAQFTDNGGLNDDEKPLPSDETSIKLSEKVDVTFAGNGGSGSMDKETVKKGSTYKLPANGFTAPENKEFDGWTVNGEAKKVGDEITVNENTTVTAKWKDSMVDVT
ncbi:MAG: InlB B-repeat-containing protein, partial [Clostridiales bacterium]|nr:InlB B-repeat-containing protein [Clostridiales bacterium]